MIIKAKINQFHYPIKIGENILDSLPKEILKFTKSKKIIILIDSNLSKQYEKKLSKVLKNSKFEISFLRVIAGKKCKDIKNLLRIVNFLEKNKFSKDSTLVALGGGTIGDLGGFAASVYYRGMNLVSIPTTLTAQIDSSIGGKVAVNYNNNVNAIGGYFHPKLILCDLKFIKTLPQRDFLSGMSEVIKSTLITSKKDTNFLIKNNKKILNRNRKIMTKMISKIIKIKINLVKKDEREKNLRLFLNYGHTIGQAIESSFNLKFEHYRHGEAVALGMLCVAYMGEKFFKIKNLYNNHLSIFKIYNLPTKILKFSNTKKQMLNKIFRNISKDKKKNHTGIRFVLLKEIGNPKIISNFNTKIIKESISRLID
jgi:3-dehydroquinate synthase